jgi:hypothetical protein
VLRADVVVLERPRLVLGEDDDLPCSFGESLEHDVLSWLGKLIVAQSPEAVFRP